MKLNINIKAPNIIHAFETVEKRGIVGEGRISKIYDNDNTEEIGKTSYKFENTCFNFDYTHVYTNAWFRNYFLIWGISPQSTKGKLYLKGLQKNVSFYITLTDQPQTTNVAEQLLDYSKYLKWETGATYLLLIGLNSLVDELRSAYQNREYSNSIERVFTEIYLYLEYCLLKNKSTPDSVCKTLCNFIFLFNKMAFISIELKLEVKKKLQETKKTQLDTISLLERESYILKLEDRMLNTSKRLKESLECDLRKLEIGSLLNHFEKGLCLIYQRIHRYWDIKIKHVDEINKLLTC